MIRFACTGCDARFTVDDGQAGQVGECPACRARFVIPGGPPRPLPAAPDGFDPDAAVPGRPCPECGAAATVRAADLGAWVACPACACEYEAAPAPVRRTRADRPRRRRPAYDPPPVDKPGAVTLMGVMLIVGGAWGVLQCVGLAVGSVCCVLSPFWVMEVVWAVLAIARGSRLVGDGARAAGRPEGLYVAQILCILNFDVPNCVLGVVGLCVAGTAEVRAFFGDRRSAGGADDE